MSFSKEQPERFDEVEALLRARMGDRSPLCGVFRGLLVTWEEAWEELREAGGAAPADLPASAPGSELPSELCDFVRNLEGADRVWEGDANTLLQHVQHCPQCRDLLLVWTRLPQRLSVELNEWLLARGPVGGELGAGEWGEALECPLPARFADLPLLQEPERLVELGLVDAGLPSSLNESLSFEGDAAGRELLAKATAELDARVGSRAARGGEAALEGGRTGTGQGRVLRGGFPRIRWVRASVAAAAVLFAYLLFGQQLFEQAQRSATKDRIELVLVSRPFDLSFGESGLQNRAPGEMGPGERDGTGEGRPRMGPRKGPRKGEEDE